MNQEQDTNAQELTSENGTEALDVKLLHQESETPLFLRDSSEGHKGNAQDEKDKVEE